MKLIICGPLADKLMEAREEGTVEIPESRIIRKGKSPARVVDHPAKIQTEAC